MGNNFLKISPMAEPEFRDWNESGGLRRGSAGFPACCIAGFPTRERWNNSGRRESPLPCRLGSRRYSRLGNLRYKEGPQQFEIRVEDCQRMGRPRLASIVTFRPFLCPQLLESERTSAVTMQKTLNAKTQRRKDARIWKVVRVSRGRSPFIERRRAAHPVRISLNPLCAFASLTLCVEFRLNSYDLAATLSVAAPRPLRNKPDSACEP